MNDALNTALDALRPAIAEEYKEWVTKVFFSMTARFGADLKQLHNSREGRTFSCVVARNVDHLEVEKQSFNEVTKVYRPQQFAYFLNPTRLEKNAAEYAQAQVDAWRTKIAAKMGELESAKVEWFSQSGQFTITGVRGGKQVAIHQTRIMKTSSRGLLFHQFPARIYLDGKFTSEAAYKRTA
jgi:hypothetical protein